MKMCVALFIILTLVGCVKEFGRGTLEGRLEVASPQVPETDIDQVVEPRPQLRFPIKIGVYFSLEAPQHQGHSQKNIWDAEDKRGILSADDSLKKDGIISEMYEIPGLLVSHPNFNILMRTAAQQGTDAVLIIKELSEVNSYADPLSILYLTIVGMWLVPGSHSDALFEIHGDLWNVGSVYLHLTVKTMGVGKIRRPIALMGDANDLATELAKKDALMSFRKEFIQKIKSLKQT